MPFSFVHSNSVMQSKLSSSYIGWILFIILCIVGSFRLYSYPYFPLLNSDHALTILHIHFFNWPADFYAYGQDRMGNLIPLLARPLYLAGVPVLWAEAIVHFGIYSFGFLAWSSFFKSNQAKAFLAIWWFFPNARLMNIVDFSFGTCISLFGIALYLLYRLQNKKPILALILYFCFNFLAIWVNDFALFFVIAATISLTLAIYFSWNNRIQYKLTHWIIANAIGAALIGVVLFYFKSKVQIEYGGLSTFQDILQIINVFLLSLQDIFLGTQKNYLESIFALVSLLMIIYIVFRLVKKNNHNSLIYILLLSILFCLIGVLATKFTLLGGVPRRYFILPYFCMLMSFLLFWENDTKANKWWSVLLFVALVSGAFSSVWEMKYIFPKSLESKAKIMAELNPEHRVMVLGNYWNSYIHSVVSPDKVYSVVKEDDLIRDWSMVERFLQFDTIYVNRDMWMDSFPDTLYQYGNKYHKYGEEFKIADSHMNLYIKQ